MRVRDRWQNLVWLKSLSSDLNPGQRDMRSPPDRFPKQEQWGVVDKLLTLAEVHGVAIDISLVGLYWTIRCVPAKLKAGSGASDISVAYLGRDLDAILHAAILDYDEMQRGQGSVRTTSVYTERYVHHTDTAQGGGQ